MSWLDAVYQDARLPNKGLVNALTRYRTVKGIYHHLSGEESLEFIKKLQVKLMEWGTQCSIRNMSAGSVLLLVASGRGHITFVAQPTGPFLD